MNYSAPGQGRVVTECLLRARPLLPRRVIGPRLETGDQQQIDHLDRVILHRDASGQWHDEATPVTSRLRAVFGVGNVVYAVGDAGVILRKP